MADPLSSTSSNRAGRRWKIQWVMLVVFLVAVGGGGELFSRYYLGLGDPMVSITDPTIEYLFAPNQSGYRFGNYYHYNPWSMRSDDFPKTKTSPREIRVLVLGDSVVNGGNLTDQKQLATSLLEEWMSQSLQRPVIVANISAGSWGPPNQLAYLEKYGLFDADVVAIEESSHDYADAPTFEPVVGIDPSFPGRKPVLALEELFFRYIPGYLRAKMGGSSHSASLPQLHDDPAKVAQCIDSFRKIIRLARGHGAGVVVVQNLEHGEWVGQVKPGYEIIRRAALDEGVTPVNLGEVYTREMAPGTDPYRDEIHPSAQGQKIMARALLGPILDALVERKTLTRDQADKATQFISH